ncbi:MAG TPA: winged helix-turn-helix domain-containing protein [Burkholderiaceae bacterium]|jgi:two-component system OmpR family response regulator
MRVLLAADETQLAVNLGHALAQAGHSVRRVLQRDFAAASSALDQELAIYQPGPAREPAWDELRRARQRGVTLPVLVVDQQLNVADRVRALDCGADDCMSAPLAGPELQARMRVLHRRCSGVRIPVRRHGPLVLDKGGHTIYLADASLPLPLTLRELRLLEIFMEQGSRPVSSKQLGDRLADGAEPISANAVQVHVHRLRKKIGGGPVRIATLPGEGYRLEAVPS